MKSKHTLGPWIVHNNRIIQGYGEENTIASSVGNSSAFDPDTNAANAALISAAPEMLETLKKVEVYLELLDTLFPVEKSLMDDVKRTLLRAMDE